MKIAPSAPVMPAVQPEAAPQSAHPREHSLAMASAAHLHKAGYISTAHHDAIRKDAAKRLSVHKKPPAPVYGSMAPQSAGHYLSTVNPGAAMDEQGGGQGGGY